MLVLEDIDNQRSGVDLVSGKGNISDLHHGDLSLSRLQIKRTLP